MKHGGECSRASSASSTAPGQRPSVRPLRLFNTDSRVAVRGKRRLLSPRSATTAGCSHSSGLRFGSMTGDERRGKFLPRLTHPACDRMSSSVHAVLRERYVAGFRALHQPFLVRGTQQVHP